MEPFDNPYAILGVPETATPREIRSAYRRAALQHHPDRAGPQATETFAKISHAYEVLTDPEQAQAYRQAAEPPPYHFHDPFSVFQSVFREEFGNPVPFRRFEDRHMMDHYSLFRDPFGDDPFFSSGFGGFFQDNLYRDPFSRHDDSIMSQMPPQMRQQMEQFPPQQNQGSFYSSSSTVSQSHIDKDGKIVTTTETTRHVNGNKEVFKETVTRDAHGNVLDRSVDENRGLLEESPNRKLFHLPWSRQKEDDEKKT